MIAPKAAKAGMAKGPKMDEIRATASLTVDDMVEVLGGGNTGKDFPGEGGGFCCLSGAINSPRICCVGQGSFPTLHNAPARKIGSFPVPSCIIAWRELSSDRFYYSGGFERVLCLKVFADTFGRE